MKFALIVLLSVVFLAFAPFPGAAEEKNYFDYLEAGFRAHIEGDYDEAIKNYTEVLRSRDLKAKDRAVTYYIRAEAYKDKGDVRRAYRDFSRAVKIKPNYAQARYQRALILEKEGRLEDAVREMSEASSLRPAEKEYSLKLGELKEKLKAWKQKEAQEKALKEKREKEKEKEKEKENEKAE